jgi:hypothetical protein
MFCVGFEGNTAIVDVSSKRANGRLSPRELAKKGLFKPAVAGAFYDKNDAELAEVLAICNAKGEVKLDSVEALKRAFGVLESFENINRVMYV